MPWIKVKDHLINLDKVNRIFKSTADRYQLWFCVGKVMGFFKEPSDSFYEQFETEEELDRAYRFLIRGLILERHLIEID